METRLIGKNALVCGSTQGIGKAIALELASLGAAITLIARNEEKLMAVQKELPTAAAQEHHYVSADFNKPDELKEALTNYLAAIEQVDILVNNSGGPPAGQAIEADVTQYRIAFNRHVICNQLLAQAIAPLMKEGGYGRIINIISTSVKAPIPGLGVSNTIRGAVIASACSGAAPGSGRSRCIAREWTRPARSRCATASRPAFIHPAGREAVIRRHPESIWRATASVSTSTLRCSSTLIRGVSSGCLFLRLPNRLRKNERCSFFLSRVVSGR